MNTINSGHSVFKYYSSVVPKQVEWLWYPYIPYGKLTIIQGDPGEGKSTFILNIAAALSTGGSLPDGSSFELPQNVVYQCAEDDAEDTIKPRLLAAGADCNRIAWIANKDRNIGHPWEVCRGGNSTHISLFVWHDSFEIDHFERTGRLTHEEAEEARKNSGYYFELEGTAWTRACETVNFFVALRKAGYPVLLLDADPILSRFKGEDLIGIVPRPVTPAYCESMFPASLGRILDFMNVYDEDMELFGDSIEWLPITPAKLL